MATVTYDEVNLMLRLYDCGASRSSGLREAGISIISTWIRRTK